MNDLTEVLASAAAEAVRRRRGAIEAGDSRNLNAVTVEVSIANGGAVLDVESYLSWKDVIRDARSAR